MSQIDAAGSADAELGELASQAMEGAPTEAHPGGSCGSSLIRLVSRYG